MAERYEIKGRIGQGGVGAVYEAYDTLLSRGVAIKRLLSEEESEVSEGGLGTDLAKEAAILSHLHHPNIITLYDISEDEEGPFVVMELIDGETIEDVVQRGAMTAEDFHVVVEQSMEALVAAQDVNLLHRDLKPTNIMIQWLSGGGFQVKILDFGLAKYSAAPAVQTVDHGGAILGSIYFLAPEQFERTPLDARTDLYALGCVYYYCLTKTYPFEGESAPDVMMAHLEHRVGSLEDIRPDIPRAISDWVMRLMSREMEDRPVDATAAIAEYRRIMADPEGAMEGGDRNSVPMPSAIAQQEAKVEAKAAAKNVGAKSGRLIMGAAAPSPEQVRRSLTSRTVQTGGRAGATTASLPRDNTAPVATPATGTRYEKSLTSRSVLVAEEGHEPVRKTPVAGIVSIIVGVVALIVAAVVFYLNRDGGDGGRMVTVGQDGRKVAVTADGIPQDGLIAHYTGWRGVMRRGNVEANSGDEVRGWEDQALPLGKNLLEVPDGKTGPTLVKVDKGEVDSLKGPTPALHFSGGEGMSIPAPDSLGDPDNWMRGITFSMVLRSVDTNHPRPIYFPSIDRNGDIAAELSYVGDKNKKYSGGVRLAPGANPGFSAVEASKTGVSIVTATWAREEGRQQLVSRLPESGAHGGNVVRMKGGPEGFNGWTLGMPGSEKSDFKGDIFELIIYNRALDEQEIEVLENALSELYFAKPSP